MVKEHEQGRRRGCLVFWSSGLVCVDAASSSSNSTYYYSVYTTREAPIDNRQTLATLHTRPIPVSISATPPHTQGRLPLFFPHVPFNCLRSAFPSVAVHVAVPPMSRGASIDSSEPTACTSVRLFSL